MPLSRHSVGTLSGNELTRNSSGNTRSQSSQLAEPLWTNPGVKSEISVRKLISTLKKQKQTQTNKQKNTRRRGMNCRTFSRNPRMRGKSHHHHHHDYNSQCGLWKRPLSEPRELAYTFASHISPLLLSSSKFCAATQN